ncbi:MAG TPA: glycosyltransferase, partial [Acidimicrobiia bacterium]|nr:glycosyltransferase [Acidimicrobiia bacterium]
AALSRLLRALRDSEVDLLVVNVGDDPEVRATASRGPGVVRVVPTPNRGYGAAVNAAAQAACGEVVVFTNDDAVVGRDTVATLAGAVLGGGADVALPRVLGADGLDGGTVLALPTPSRLLVEWALLPDRPIPGLEHLPVEKWRRPEVAEDVAAGSAVTVAARTEVLRATPMPDDYFLYWEELEWFWRLRARGAAVVFVPDATVVHDGGRGDVRVDKSRLLARNAVRCVRRTQGRRAALAAYGVVILWNARLVATAALCAHRTLRPRLAGLGAALTSWREIR